MFLLIFFVINEWHTKHSVPLCMLLFSWVIQMLQLWLRIALYNQSSVWSKKEQWFTLFSENIKSNCPSLTSINSLAHILKSIARIKCLSNLLAFMSLLIQKCTMQETDGFFFLKSATCTLVSHLVCVNMWLTPYHHFCIKLLPFSS